MCMMYKNHVGEQTCIQVMGLAQLNLGSYRSFPNSASSRDESTTHGRSENTLGLLVLAIHDEGVKLKCLQQVRNSHNQI